MTSQTSRNTGWRRAAVGAVASGALAAGLMAGIGLADAEPVAPADPTTGADAPASDDGRPGARDHRHGVRHGCGWRTALQPGPPGHEASFAGFLPVEGQPGRHRGRVGQAAEPGATDRGPPKRPWPSRPGTRCAVRRSSRLRRRSGSISTTRPTPAPSADSASTPAVALPAAESTSRSAPSRRARSNDCSTSWSARRTAARCFWPATCSTTRGCGVPTGSKTACPCCWSTRQ